MLKTNIVLGAKPQSNIQNWVENSSKTSINQKCKWSKNSCPTGKKQMWLLKAE
jgi:hypothetical protein